MWIQTTAPQRMRKRSQVRMHAPRRLVSRTHCRAVVACFYVKFDDQTPEEDSYYRAIYLQQRSLDHLIAAVTAKADLGDINVTKVLRVCPNGLQIKLDGQVVEQIPEAQDMTAEFVRSVASPRDAEQSSYTLILKY